MGASNLPFFATASSEATESNRSRRHGQQGVGGDLLAVVTSASCPGLRGRPMLDSSSDRRSDSCYIDGFGSAEVAAGLRGGAGERLLPVHPIWPLHTLPLLREGPPILSSFGWSLGLRAYSIGVFLC
jgi:hypothetical protein